MGKGCKRYSRKCERYRQKALELQMQEVCSIDSCSSFEDSSYCTTSMTSSESSETTSMSEEGATRLPVDPRVFREVVAKGQRIKCFLHEEGDVMIKWHRCRYACDYDPLEVSIETATRTQEILKSMEICVDMKKWKIDCIVPKSGFVTPPLHKYPHGRPCIIQKFIPNLLKANSNTGWFRPACSYAERLVQMIPHYSYAKTNGKLVICNYYYHINKKEKQILIISPDIMTKGEGHVYGNADLGTKGIRNFFCYYCHNGLNAGYKLPCHLTAYFKPSQTTLLDM